MSRLFPTTPLIFLCTVALATQSIFVSFRFLHDNFLENETGDLGVAKHNPELNDDGSSWGNSTGKFNLWNASLSSDTNNAMSIQQADNKDGDMNMDEEDKEETVNADNPQEEREDDREEGIATANDTDASSGNGTDEDETASSRIATCDYANPINVYPPLKHIVFGKSVASSNQEPFTINITFGHQSISSNATSLHADDNSNIIASSNSEHNNFATIDILSTGSTTRLNYLQSQMKSWASHVSVRNFWGVTELNDVEPNCTQRMMSQAIDFVNDPLQITNEHFKWCKRTKANPNTDSNVMSLFRHFYGTGTRRKGAGWMCAQVRFGQALGKVGVEYRRRLQLELNEKYINESEKEEETSEKTKDFNDLLRLHADFLPDYLLLVDDDTYVNLDLFQKLVKNATANAKVGSNNNYLSGLHEDTNKPLVYAGCMTTLKTGGANLTAYTGGYGAILSKGTVARMIHPIYCEKWKEWDHLNNITKLSEAQNFEWKVCKRIEENILGEKGRFVDGMTITDLSFALSNSTDAFCLNSDWLQAYLLGYYFLSDHEPPEIAMTQDQGSRIVPFLQGMWPGQSRICENNEPSKCDESKYICHYQTPERMEMLTHTIHSNSPEAFRSND